MLDEVDLTLDFLLPLVLVVLLALLILLLEFSDFLKLRLLFDLENGLLGRLGKENIKNWLNFAVEVK